MECDSYQLVCCPPLSSVHSPAPVSVTTTTVPVSSSTYRQVRMFNAVQPKTPGAVMAGLQQHGASVGAKKLMQWEFRHAREAIQSGIYVTLYNDYRKHECTRYIHLILDDDSL